MRFKWLVPLLALCVVLGSATAASAQQPGRVTGSIAAAAATDVSVQVQCGRTYTGRIGRAALEQNACMAAGAFLETAWYWLDGRFQQLTLTFQSDGNFVLYRWISGQGFGSAIWATNTSGKSVGVAAMQTDGNFVLYDSIARPYWSTNTWNCPGSWNYRQLDLQADENVVLYMWPSNGGGRQAKWDRWGIARC